LAQQPAQVEILKNERGNGLLGPVTQQFMKLCISHLSSCHTHQTTPNSYEVIPVMNINF
jgi:hypothetical protein